MVRFFVSVLLLIPAVAGAQNMGTVPTSNNSMQTSAFQAAPLAALSIPIVAAARDDVAHVSTLIQPKLIHTVEISANGRPHYFVSARKRIVALVLDVTPNGSPTNIVILDPQNIDLDQEVIATVRQYRFRPATLNGKPATMAVRLDFVLTPGSIY